MARIERHDCSSGLPLEDGSESESELESDWICTGVKQRGSDLRGGDIGSWSTCGLTCIASLGGARVTIGDCFCRVWAVLDDTRVGLETTPCGESGTLTMST